MLSFIEKLFLKFILEKWRKAIMLSGYKTYIIGMALVVYGVAGYIAGVHDVDMLIHRVLEGLAFMGLRAGISKVGR